MCDYTSATTRDAGKVDVNVRVAGSGVSDYLVDAADATRTSSSTEISVAVSDVAAIDAAHCFATAHRNPPSLATGRILARLDVQLPGAIITLMYRIV